MYLTNLTLKNFRSYEDLNLQLFPGTTTFLGKNGEGKTNIVEAILYLSFLNSHRTSSDQPLVKLGEKSAYVRAVINTNDREVLVEIEINSEKANRARINQNPIKSQKELFGLLSCVYFSPEDLDIVRGDPSERRRFINQLLISNNPRMAGVINDYERALKQRNALLKSRSNQSSLQSWNEQLAKYGGEILASRISNLEAFVPIFTDTYKNISPEKTASLSYKSSLENITTNPDTNKELILQKIEEVKYLEIDRGITLVGPHRDDLQLHLGDHFVKGYASQGESWSIALSLKLSMYHFLKNNGGAPILILDDVFSELDTERRKQLVEIANSATQSFVTVADIDDLPKNLSTALYVVKSGEARFQKRQNNEK